MVNLLIILTIVSVFEVPLSKIFNISFNYADELLIIIAFAYFLFSLIRNRKEKSVKGRGIILLLNFLLILVGLVGNIIFLCQSSKIAIAADIISWQKFILMLVIFISILKTKNAGSYYNKMEIVSKYIIYFGLVYEACLMLNLIDLCDAPIRHGMKSFSLMGHPSTTSAVYACIIGLLFTNKKKNIKWILAASFLCIATFRTKSYAFVMIAMPLLFIDYSKLFNKKNIVKILLATFVIAALIVACSYKKVEYYFLRSEITRAVLLKTSFKIASDKLPIGTGFASFGTVASGEYYSNVYKEYGLINQQGLTIKDHSFVGDGGVATIIGQFGYLGTIIFAVCIAFVIKYVFKHIKGDANSIVAAVIMFVYLFISCTNETVFNNTYSILFALFLALICKRSNKSIKDVVV